MKTILITTYTKGLYIISLIFGVSTLSGSYQQWIWELDAWDKVLWQIYMIVIFGIGILLPLGIEILLQRLVWKQRWGFIAKSQALGSAYAIALMMGIPIFVSILALTAEGSIALILMSIERFFNF